MRPNQFIINRNHPLANGLKFAMLSESNFDYAANIQGTMVNSPGRIVNPRRGWSFDGASNYLTLNTHRSFLRFIWETHLWTISFWLRRKTPSTRIDWIFGNSLFRNTEADLTGFWIYADDVGKLFSYTIGGITQTLGDRSNSNILTDTNWHHIILVGYRASGTGYNRSQIYLDGVAVSMSTGAVNSTIQTSADATQAVKIGALYRPSDDLFVYANVEIADIMVWNRTFSVSEVGWLYRSRSDPLLGGLIMPNRGLYYPYTNIEAASGNPFYAYAQQ